jgi:alkylation response protein AidB-like acyl-CoA dehydrogenase
MAIQIEAAQLLNYRAAYNKSNDLPYSKEAAMAKKFASDTAMAVTTNAVQIFGGYGFSEEYPAARVYRDARVLNLYEGTSQIQRMILAMDALGTRPANGPGSPMTPIDRYSQ